MLRQAKRLLAIIRLSKDRDTTNSPAGQRSDIEDYTLETGDIIVGWVEEIDVSGGIPIRERPEAGPWLAEDRLDEWDGIIGSRLDRLFRSQLDYLLWVRDFCDQHDKIIIDVEGGIDTSTPQGRRELNNRAQMADYERQRIAENRGKAQKRIRLDARYGGGPVPFGYKKERIEGGWILVIYEPHREIIIDMVDRILAGESANAICVDFNERGIPSSTDAQRILNGKQPKGIKWETTQMLRLLRSPALKGVVMNYPKKGEKWTRPVPVIGRDGMPVRRQALIEDDTWDKLQEMIKPEDRSYYRANAATLLLGVAFCGECSGALHSERKTGRDRIKQRRYYGCAERHYGNCKARLIPMEELDQAVNDAIMAIGNQDDYDTKRAKSNGNRERKIREIGEAIVELTTERFVRNVMRPNYDDLMANLQAEQERLRIEPEPEPEPERVKTGKTIEQAWNERDIQGKRLWLLKRGVKVFATRAPDDFVTVGIEGGELTEDFETLGFPTREHLRELADLPKRLAGMG
jgi:site-specific DNA recombinase